MNCVTRELPAELSSVSEARHWTRDQCAGALDEDARQILELLTTEVVANAVQHGDEPLVLAVGCAPGEVLVAVTDSNPAPPVARRVSPEATGGRGVALVAALAQAWGWAPQPPGKRVWFRLTSGGTSRGWTEPNG